MEFINNFEIEIVHKSFIKNGDLIIFNNKAKTVCNKDIKIGFTGLTIFGDPFKLNNEMVTRFKKNSSGALIHKNKEI